MNLKITFFQTILRSVERKFVGHLIQFNLNIDDAAPLFPTFKLTQEGLHSFVGATFLDGIGSVIQLVDFGFVPDRIWLLSNFHSDSDS